MKSDWRRWDLHIHTPASFENQFTFIDEEERDKYSDDIFEKYIDYLENLTEVECLGVTDYFSIEGYRKIFEAQQSGRLQNFKLILPNIEFRLNTILEIGADRKSKKINFHVIFSNEITPDIIENEFLSSLNFVDESNSKYSLRKDSLIKFGERIQSVQPEFSKFSSYAAGCISASVELNDIIEILNSKSRIFNGKYLLVLAAENLSAIQWASQGHTIRRQLMAHSHAVFTGSPSDKEFLLGEKAESVKVFLKEFKKLWPVLHGSDAHTFEQIFKPDLERYCWIKSEPTFEGLKQIIYEPSDRVFIGKNPPDFTRYSYSIDRFDVESNPQSQQINFEDSRLELSRGLVAVIGGKGSGKTALLDLIAHSFTSRLYADLDDSEKLISFVGRNTNPKNKNNIEIRTNITFPDGKTYSKSISSSDVHTANITYLSQGKIDEYSNDSTRLQDKIRQIIFERTLFIRPDLVENYEFCKLEIANTVKSINNTSSELKSLYFDISQYSEQSIRDGIIDKRAVIKSIEIEIKELVSKSKESSLRYEEIVNRQKVFNDLIQTYKQFRRNLIELRRGLPNTHSFNATADLLNSKLTDLGIQGHILLLNVAEVEISISELESKLIELAEYNEAALEDVKSEIDQLTTESAKIDSLQERMSSEMAVLNDLNAKFETLKGKVKEIEDKRILQRKNVYELLIKHQNLRQAYSDVIAFYSQDMPELLRDIEFEAEVSADFDSWYEDIANLFYSRQGSALETIRGIFTDFEEKCGSPDALVVTAALTASINTGMAFKKNKTMSDLEALLYTPPIRIKTQIKYLGKDMDNLSMGQRGTVLLSIYLADGDNTLIIDQPEENLDNKYIYGVLVNSIRKAKQKRQIIIATHNANLVVNTDAEQIIIADYKDDKIVYRTGTIEDNRTRSEIALILEGGNEAFKKREQRYSSNQTHS